MNLLPNGVAVCGKSHHAQWCSTEGLVHDKWMESILKNLVEQYGIKVAVNAGAHIGTLARVLLDCKVETHCFEPNESAIECLEYNCREASIYRVALSSASGQLPFTRLDNAGASYVSPVAKATPGAEFVRCRPLDEYDLNPQFILADCEGSEVAMLRGAEKTIQRCKPVMILEVNLGALERMGESDESLINELEYLGYTRQILQPDCRWGDPQFDILCLPLL